MPKYRKNPVVIEAEQFLPEEGKWPGGVEDYGKTHPYDRRDCSNCKTSFRENHGYVHTLEDGHIACPGDWIITGIKGEKYPCKPDIFEKTYAPADEAEGALFDEDVLGRLVRDTWVEWAQQQPNPKPSWLLPWSELDEGQKEVDRRIGRAVTDRAVLVGSGEMSKRLPCAIDEHPWERLVGIIKYPRCETFYWCPACGALRRIVRRHDALAIPETLVDVIDDVRVPQGAKT